MRKLTCTKLAIVLSCVFPYTKLDAQAGGTIDTFVAPSKWLDVGFRLSPEAPAVLVKLVSALSTEETMKYILCLAIFTVALDAALIQVSKGQKVSLAPVVKVNMPATGFATKPKDDEPETCKGDEPVTKDSVSPATLRNLYLQANSCCTAPMYGFRLYRIAT